MKIAREGFPFILPFLALSITFLVLGWWVLFLSFLVIALAFSFFFRDPLRTIPQGENLLVAPADGKIVNIENLGSHPSFPSSTPVTSISIFLSLFDVHLTRAPLAGTVQKIEYKAGKFFPAYKDQAGWENESNSMYIKGDKTDTYLKQIVGVAARRIKCFVKENDRIARGEKIGLMYFGSRVEIYLSQGVTIKACLHQRLKAGETVIAEVKQ
jgi:phosphatidylserine decarboxylase